MKLIEKLMQEHQLILKMLDLFLKRPEEQDPQAFLDFIENFADQYHHAKEEQILFTGLEQAQALSHCNPVRQMLFEHDQARFHVSEMKKSWERRHYSDLSRHIQNYCFLLQQHIYKEDHILYPMAEQSLSQAIQKNLDQAFQKMEKDLKGSEITAKYERIHARLGVAHVNH